MQYLQQAPVQHVQPAPVQYVQAGGPCRFGPPERKTTPPGGLQALMAGVARTIEKLRKELEAERAAHKATLEQFKETARPVGCASALPFQRSPRLDASPFPVDT